MISLKKISNMLSSSTAVIHEDIFREKTLTTEIFVAASRAMSFAEIMHTILMKKSEPEIDQVFYSKLEKFRSVIGEHIGILEDCHRLVSKYLTNLAPKQIKISITDSPSIFYTLRRIRDIFDLKFEVFCSDPVEIVFTLYLDGSIILRSSGDLQSVIQELTPQFDQVKTVTRTDLHHIQGYEKRLPTKTFTYEVEDEQFVLLWRTLSIKPEEQFTMGFND